MKRLIIICVSAALLVAALVVPSFASSGSISLSLSVPFLEYTFVDDSDDPFESFVAYASYAGRSEEFWSSDDPDMLMIPDIYLVSGMHFYIEGSTPSGSTVRSNTVTYIEDIPLPFLTVYTADGWDILRYDPFDFSSRVSSVYFCALKNGTLLGRFLSQDSSGIITRSLDIFSFLYSIGALSTVSDGDFITFQLRAYDSADNLIATGRNFNYQFVNPYLHMPLLLDDNYRVSSGYKTSAYDLTYWISSAAVQASIEIYFLDDDTLCNRRSVDLFKLGSPIVDFETANMLESGYAGSFTGAYYNNTRAFVLERSVKYRFKFVIGDRFSDQFTFYSPFVVAGGIDGFGDLVIPEDTLLYKPSDQEALYYSNLLYRGVLRTPVYRYIFSALVICLPFAAAVFVIHKVH